MSTLINVLTVENQMTQAQINAVQAQSDFAQAIIQLRFDSGTLLSREGDTVSLREADLTSLPVEEVKEEDSPADRKQRGKRPRR